MGWPCWHKPQSTISSSLRHYPQAHSQGHHSINQLEQKGVERKHWSWDTIHSHTAKDSTASTSWRRKGYKESTELGTLSTGTQLRTSQHQPAGRERGRKKALSLWHYPQAHSQGHHSINQLEEKGSSEHCNLPRPERAVIRQTSTGTISKATLDKRQGIWAFSFTECRDTILT